MKYNTITKQVSETVPGGIYEGIDYHGTPPADVAARAGWVDVTPEIQAQLDADAAAAQAAHDAAEIIRKNTPVVYDHPIEAEFVVLRTPSGKGVGYVAAEDGTLLPVRYAHESPYDIPELDSKIDAVRAKHATSKTERAAEAVKVQANSGTANSVPKLREQVAALAKLVEQLINDQAGVTVTP